MPATARNVRRSPALRLRWRRLSRRRIFASPRALRKCFPARPARPKSWSAGSAATAAQGFIMCPAGRRYPNRNIKPGTLDDASWLVPTTHFWTRSAQPWVAIQDGAVRHETQPDSLGGCRRRRKPGVPPCTVKGAPNPLISPFKQAPTGLAAGGVAGATHRPIVINQTLADSATPAYVGAPR